MKNHFRKTVLAGLGSLLLSSMAHAGLIDLVENGEFEDSAIKPDRWTATYVEGWESSEGRIEIWNQSFQWGARLGTDGEATGQHAEITWNHDRAEIWTHLLIPEWFVSGTDAHFRFDYQNRRAQGLWASVLINDADPLQFAVSSQNSWSLFESPIEGLNAGDNIKLLFKSQGGASMGAHIDQVQFLVQDPNAVPLPGTAALMLLGAGAFAWRRREPRGQTSGNS